MYIEIPMVFVQREEDPRKYRVRAASLSPSVATDRVMDGEKGGGWKGGRGTGGRG